MTRCPLPAACRLSPIVCRRRPYSNRTGGGGGSNNDNDNDGLGGIAPLSPYSVQGRRLPPPPPITRCPPPAANHPSYVDTAIEPAVAAAATTRQTQGHCPRVCILYNCLYYVFYTIVETNKELNNNYELSVKVLNYPPPMCDQQEQQ